MTREAGRSWHVRRTSGLLVPGFTKRFDAGSGMTFFFGVPIGRFDVDVAPEGSTELRYRRWPVVDVLERPPTDVRVGTIPSAGFVRLPGHRRVRFCRFRLEP